MTIKAVIFDLDGTLVHTKPEYLEQLIRRCCADLGIKPTKESIEKIWFGNLSEKEKIMTDGGINPEHFWRKFVEYDTIEERTKHLEPYGDCWVLRKLAEKGIKLGIVTNAVFHMAEHEVDILRSHGIEFDAIVVAFNRDLSVKVKPKPHPEGINECLRMLGAKSNEAVFVGNGPDDTEAAKAAGVLDVNIERGEHLIDVGATVSIKSLEEILGMIE
ncbi:MAG: HAD family hydrolase [Candidatus Aenigmarchaeota archaeon]|nr:HAD family hydrolase [Candidatus Aenigmarchaeota archaeon]